MFKKEPQFNFEEGKGSKDLGTFSKLCLKF